MPDHEWNMLVCISAGIALALIAGFAAGAAFVGGCAELKDAPYGCAEWWLSRYQTLIAMIGGFAVAFLVTKPVWRQLRLTSLQTTITLQQTLRVRERLLADRAAKDMKITDKLSKDVRVGYSHREDDPGVLTHWVWDMANEVESEIRRLQNRQAENLDGDEAAIARQNLIQSLKRLADCMYDYNGSVHLGYMEDEIAITPELEADVAAKEIKAAHEMPDKIEDVDVAVDELRRAFDEDLVEIRQKRQLIDQVLVNAEVIWVA